MTLTLTLPDPNLTLTNPTLTDHTDLTLSVFPSLYIQIADLTL